MGRIWTIEEKKFVEDNYLHMKYNEIGLSIGRSTASVLLYCSMNKLRKGHRIYTYNEEFFDMPSIKSAYWAGLIAADGSVDLGRGVLSLSLKAEDGYQIEVFKSEIDYTGPTYSGYGKIGNKKFPRTTLSLNSAWPFIAQLKKHYNIGPKKSHTLGAPQLGDKSLLKAYIVGYLDGDGSIDLRDRREPLMVGFVGSYTFMSWIKSLFDEWYPAKKRMANVVPDHSIFKYRVSGKRAHTILTDLSMLKVSFLKRKWDKVLGG
jgi:hypothetical protein